MKKWWLYWIAYQLVGLVWLVQAAVILLLPAALAQWRFEPTTKGLFKGSLKRQWMPDAIGISSTLTILALCGLRMQAHYPKMFLFIVVSICAALLARAYDNWEDGVVPPPLVNGKPYLQNWPDRIRAYVWCLRNSGSGMRELPGASFLIDSKDLVITKKPWGYTAVASGRPCIARWGFRIGWLINLDAATGWRCWPIAGNTKGVAT